MVRFRPSTGRQPSTPVGDPFSVGQLIDSVFLPGHFLIDPDLGLAFDAARSETIPWEVFRGRLMPRSQTRETQTFLAWNLIAAGDDEPTISVKFDLRGRQIHVTRGFRAFVWEGHDGGGGIIESREVVQWTRELVGTIELVDFEDDDSLRDELVCLIWQAVVGTSRLPLTSVEAPLPAYTFGQLHYCFHEGAGDTPFPSWQALLDVGLRPGLAPEESSKIVEFLFRRLAPSEMPAVVDRLLAVRPADGNARDLIHLWQRMFNDVSLSPYTTFVDNALLAFDLLAPREAIGEMERIDFLRSLLCQLGRHLTAYDLVTFHHRGANYPDALLLDAILKRYLDALRQNPAPFLEESQAGRKLRRALRHGCLLRRQYEGHFVPDHPTSPGENARIMPASHPRVPEEQLLQPLRRRRQLFANEPLPRFLDAAAIQTLARSEADLVDPEERAELGRGVFIDRPLGYGKALAEPDLTPLVAHVAFSPSLARRRWQALHQLLADLGVHADSGEIATLMASDTWPPGLPQTEVAECPRPTAALCDVRKVADDFRIERTLPGGVRQLLGDSLDVLRLHFRLGFLERAGPRLCVQTPDRDGLMTLALYDSEFRRRVEIVILRDKGFRTRARTEWPRAGLQVRRVWEDATESDGLTMREVDLVLRR